MAEGNFIIRARDQTRDAFASVDNRLRGLSRIQRLSLGGLGGALSVAGLVRYGRSVLNTADNIDNLSKRMRLGHESVQSMGVLMREAGMPVESLGNVMDRLQQQQANAINGSANAAKSFEALGISLEDLESATPEQLLERVARHLHTHQGNASKSAAATDVLGARSIRLQGVLQTLGESGFEDLNKQMLKTSQIMQGDMVHSADRMEEHLSRASNRLSVKFKEFGAGSMSALYMSAGIPGSLLKGMGIDTELQTIMDRYDFLMGYDTPPSRHKTPAQELHEEAPEIGKAIADPIVEAVKRTTEFLTGGRDVQRHFAGLIDESRLKMIEEQKTRINESKSSDSPVAKKQLDVLQSIERKMNGDSLSAVGF